ncbi:cell division protein FtsZ [Candidatus Woesearchaeota archaeon]|jgi:cell division protein FtsZ|nr:cell division protein FtsZ [Candidatus Woesearchaeota archaeon]MBT6023594.1 cell division protein FtsZ [Candidatus Woesearchaeota archaeon]
MDPYDDYSDNVDYNTGADNSDTGDTSKDSYDSLSSDTGSTDSFLAAEPTPAQNTSFESTSFDSQEAVSSLSKDDEELEKVLANRKARIKVIGCGGAGNNTISRISEIGVTGAEIIAVNTDAQDLLNATADRKLLIGKDLTQGLGAGSDPRIGKDAAKESQKEIRESLQDAHMIFITGGLGGGTGTGCMPEIASIAKKLGILTVAVVTLPFEMEGVLRHENAMIGLEELEGLVDTLILIPNDKLIELAPDLPLHTAFKVADEILTNAVKGIAELITKPGLINLDFADIKAVMSSGGIAMIGLGESDTENRAVESVEKALNNPLLDVEVSGATGALINVMGGPDMTLDEARTVVENVTQRLDENSKIIWGAQLSPELQNSIRTMLVVVGVKSPQIFGPKRTMSKKKQEDLEGNFGIKFID